MLTQQERDPRSGVSVKLVGVKVAGLYIAIKLIGKSYCGVELTVHADSVLIG